MAKQICPGVVCRCGDNVFCPMHAVTVAPTDCYGAFHVEHFVDYGGCDHWCVIHTITHSVCHTGLTEDAAREIAGTMRESKPTDL